MFFLFVLFDKKKKNLSSVAFFTVIFGQVVSICILVHGAFVGLCLKEIKSECISILSSPAEAHSRKMATHSEVSSFKYMEKKPS